jgi:hypothetical protein
LRGEVDLVGRRTDAGRELHDEVGGIAAEDLLHASDRRGGDAKFGAFFAGMGDATDPLHRISDENGAAVGDPDPEKLSGDRGDEGIGRGEMEAGRMRPGDDADPRVVDLLARGEMIARDAGRSEQGSVERLETGKGLLAVTIDPDVGAAEEKPVLQSGQVGERGEGFDEGRGWHFQVRKPNAAGSV